MIEERRYKLCPESPSGIANAYGRHIGSRNHNGYFRLQSSGKKALLAHRVVWILHNGPIPEGMVIDHINRIRDDNRIENLRLATISDNNSNCGVRSHCKSGAKYIATTKEGRFHVRIKRKSYGSFDTLDEAVAARDKLLSELQ